MRFALAALALLGLVVNRVALWTGATWRALGTGTTTGEVRDVVAASDGRGYVAGTFSSIGASSAELVASWDGSAWSPIGGTNMDGLVVPRPGRKKSWS